MPEDYARALDLAVRLVEEGGALIRRELHRSGGPRGARAHAPVDEAVERRLRQGLTTAFPDWGYRGEETRPHLRARDRGEHIWLVDPNDGTADFLRGERGSAISIGLLRRGEPVLGVVYAPCAPDDAGDLFAWAEGCGPPRRNGVALDSPDWPRGLDEGTVALLSSGAERRAVDNLRVLAPGRFRALPSIAYRLALAAAGDGAVAVSLHTPGAWDYGGGHALVRGAGGVFVDETGAPVRYAADGSSRVGWCFGGSPSAVEALLRRPWLDVLRGAPPAWPDPALPFDFLRARKGEAVADAGLLARAQGCLLGALAGDAVATLGGEGVPGRVAGQPSAVAEPALLLARSIAHEGRYDAAAVARAYGWWARTAPAPLDPATARALGAIPVESAPASKAEEATIEAPAAAAAATRAEADPASHGSAPLARVAPLGVWGHRLSPNALAAHARAESALTHPSPTCADACAALAVAIGDAVRSGEGPTAAHAAATDWAQRAGAAGPVQAALTAAAARPAGRESREQGAAVAALHSAFYALLHAPSLEEGVLQVAMADVDGAAAAIAGALLGAVHGRGAVPLRWRRAILSCRPTAEPPGAAHPRPRPLWPVDLLVLAERLLVAGGGR
jgi:fructose-1,6-bisphosphatase/inositol monophosphatase family enzyme/ADP-ribosylglycohydrolase